MASKSRVLNIKIREINTSRSFLFSYIPSFRSTCVFMIEQDAFINRIKLKINLNQCGSMPIKKI